MVMTGTHRGWRGKSLVGQRVLEPIGDVDQQFGAHPLRNNGQGSGATVAGRCRQLPFGDPARQLLLRQDA